MEIRYFNDWINSQEMRVFFVGMHDCGRCAGMDFFILGFGIAFRIETHDNDLTA